METPPSAFASRTRGLPARTGTGGFTLIELLITLVILALLASGAVSLFEIEARRARESELRTALRDIRTAIDAYKKSYDDGHITKIVDASGYPPSLNVLEEGVIDAKSPTRTRIYFMRRVPRDPFADPELSASNSWGLRSYASSPDDPEPGADVFDVYSTNKGIGLNDVPYSKW